MAELRELLATDVELLVFGSDQALFVLDHGAVKTLLLTEGALAKLPKEKQAQLGNVAGKFRGAEIVRFAQGSAEHTEVQSFE
jgi:stalled ribosome rescue protein Dom34